MIEKLGETPIYDASGEYCLGTTGPDLRTIVNKVNEIIDVINKEEENV